MVDVERCVDLTAEYGCPVIVEEPVDEPWIDLILLIEVSESMVLWQDTAREFEGLCARLGAFRHIQRQYFDIAAVGSVDLPNLEDIALRLRVSDSGERSCLVLVFTDCVSDPWHEGSLIGLEPLQDRFPIALLQPLPERHWVRTGLAYHPRIDVTTAAPASPASKLDCVKHIDCERMVDTFLVPITSLDPHHLSKLVQLLIAQPGNHHPAYLAAYQGEDGTAAVEVPSDTDDAVGTFLRDAPWMAKRLSEYLSLVPLTLPVIRLVQRAALPESRIDHLAEVLLGGLLEPVAQDDQDALPIEKRRFEFLPGVRERLRDRLTVPQQIEMLRRVSDQVQALLHSGFPFSVILEHADGIRDLDPEAYRSDVFAQCSIDLLRQMGGDHKRIASKWLAAWRTPPRTPTRVQPTPTSQPEPGKPTAEARQWATQPVASRGPDYDHDYFPDATAGILGLAKDTSKRRHATALWLSRFVDKTYPERREQGVKNGQDEPVRPNVLVQVEFCVSHDIFVTKQSGNRWLETIPLDPWDPKQLKADSFQKMFGRKTEKRGGRAPIFTYAELLHFTLQFEEFVKGVPISKQLEAFVPPFLVNLLSSTPDQLDLDALRVEMPDRLAARLPATMADLSGLEQRKTVVDLVAAVSNEDLEGFFQTGRLEVQPTYPTPPTSIGARN